MIKAFYSVLFIGCFFSLGASAMEGGINQGGFGFLYPDSNAINDGLMSNSTTPGFTNPGALTNNYGTSIQGSYLRSDSSGGEQEFTPSATYGNGKFGIGVYGSRVSTNLTEPAEALDQLGVGAGVSLIHDRLDFGVGFAKQVSANPVANGTAAATLTLHGSKGMGASLGFELTDTFNKNGTATTGGTVALGYGFKHNTSIEADATFLNSSDLNNFVLGGFVNIGSRMVYLSGGYQYWNDFYFKNEVVARLGFILGKNVDFSVMAGDYLESGATLNYGGTLRFSF